MGSKTTEAEFTAPVPLFGLPDMDFGSLALQGVLGLVSMAFPPAAPFIAIAEKAAPYIIKAMPLIKAGIKEGPGAFAAAKAAAPELSAAITSMADHLQALGKNFGNTPEGHMENVARAFFGERQMTFEQEMQWMNSTAGNDPSQENSQKGSG